jgi:hypothetical protein
MALMRDNPGHETTDALLLDGVIDARLFNRILCNLKKRGSPRIFRQNEHSDGSDAAPIFYFSGQEKLQLTLIGFHQSGTPPALSIWR